VTGSYIEIPTSDGQLMPAYLVESDRGEYRAGVVLLQEIFGVNANMRGTADTIASLGYDVIVPDLFWRQELRVELDPSSVTDRERATSLMKGLNQEQAINDALGAATYLRTAKRVSGKIGVLGYCLGGKLAFLLAMRANIAAAVSYYGVAIQSALDRVDELQAPLLLHIAMEDHLCLIDAQKAIHKLLDSRADVEIIDYPGVGHAFARRGGASFNLEAAERADSATAAFLARNLLSKD
jgi:carboxymethylenebutenolidase